MSTRNLSDTVVAPITGSPPAAVAVVRVSGPRAYEVAARVFQPWPDRPEPRRALYGRFSHGDDGLALPFEAGRSYTGDETVEFSVHGSAASLRLLLDACTAAGARLAGPGEFTMRAFLNGRIDLTQAEAVRDAIEAQTESQLRQARSQMDGRLRTEVAAVRGELVRLLAAVEASVDFSEEIGELDRAGATEILARSAQRLEQLVEAGRVGRIIREGLRIAICGRPNAGKSSLLNAVLGHERAIVTAVPGTTRDTIEESADFRGMRVVLVDTAGLRAAKSQVESIGVARARAEADRADLVWHVFDLAKGWSKADAEFAGRATRPVLRIGTKADLVPPPARPDPEARRAGSGKTVPAPDVVVSSVTRAGLDDLVGATLERFALADASAPCPNARHMPLLASAREHVGHGLETLAHDLPDDLLSTVLQAAIRDLGQITGDTATEDMVDAIFRDFCIGK
ncbi:MAG: tRNA uridine-5-carboxymethylaminomethyl(34) synthesis GTPase MnmE [Fimbriimonadaceae bacterium]